MVARFALGANTPEETVYPAAFTDSEGRPLRGRHRYTIRFPRGQLPPVGAFWSLTMYDGEGYLHRQRPTATPSATAPRACAAGATARSPSTSSTAIRRGRAADQLAARAARAASG